MLDQNTDRMWYVIGAVVIGAAMLFAGMNIYTDSFDGVTDSFESGLDFAETQSDLLDEESIAHKITYNDYVPIASAEDLDAIRNEGVHTFGTGTKWENEYEGGLDKKYVQVASIDLGTYGEWTPIDSFTGIYEGSGQTISNLTVNRDIHLSFGLFGGVQGAVIQNVRLQNIDVEGTDYVGGLAGHATNGSEIEAVYVTGRIKHEGLQNGSEVRAGGVVGELSQNSQLSKSHTEVIINGRANVGGLVGHLHSSKITDSYAHGAVLGMGSVGGLVGAANNQSIIETSYANVKTISSDPNTGGLLGRDADSQTIVESSYWDAETSETTTSAGDKGEGRSTYEMTLVRTFEGWDFENTWRAKEGVEHPSFEGENEFVSEVTITFIGTNETEHKVTGIIGATLEDYYEGVIPTPDKDGYTFIGWETITGESFGMDTVLGEDPITIVPVWKLNEIVTKTFRLPEGMSPDQIRDIEIENMHELISYDVDQGNIRLNNQVDNKLTFGLSDRTHDRKVQTGGEEILADTKEVVAQNSSNYDKDGYKGSLSRYVYSGSYTPSDTKSVSGQTSRNYNSGGYSGTLSRYQAGGSYTSADSKYVSGQTSSYYNSGGYSGSLSRYVYSGSYTPSDTKSIDERGVWGYVIVCTDPSLCGGKHNSIPSGIATRNRAIQSYMGRTKSYNSGGYTGTLTVTRTSTNNSLMGYDFRNGCTVSDYGMSYYYTGTVRRPSSDTRVYRYRGDVTRPASDSRYYRYRGSVTRPASDTRQYRYKGTVNRPYSDSRTWDHFYKYAVTVSYREK